MKCYICDTRLLKRDIMEVKIKDQCGWSNKDNAWIDTIVTVHDYCYEQDSEEEYELVE